MEPKNVYPIPDLKTLLSRGWHKKCPQCGQGRIYKGWLSLHDHCSHCGLQFLANQGDLLGPLVFFDRVLFLIPFITIFYFGVWHPNQALMLFCGALMFGTLVFTTPNRNGISVAFDYYLRRRNGDLSGQGNA